VIGKGLVKIFRLKNPPHWAVNAVVLLVLLLLPGLLISWATGTIYRWGNLELILFGIAAPVMYLVFVVVHVILEYNILPGVRDYIVDAIQSMDSLNLLEKWLSPYWSTSRWLTFALVLGFFNGLLSIMIFIPNAGGFIDIGIVVSIFLISLCPTIAVYGALRLLILPIELANCQLYLYESDPMNSEIIQRLIYILNVYIYIVVGYCAIATMIFALSPEMFWLVCFFVFQGWLPTIAQFLVNQYAIRKIIINAKWQSLNRLQTRISELQQDVLTDAPEKAIVQLNQLMDLHDRISKKPNSALNWGTGLSFLNQLMLPLLGLILGNVDKLLNLLKP